ncbi:YkvA family protein [Microbispora sp. ATCC PTA-5024]|uniref:YkvA family protein n=1 Tax=Microbispora sp. ATCC PTA-5024 TaxID=316330 RepID=UPI000561F6C2|nr:YkvA family protein [Microbispora sp. ATCC PTA-5024]
MVKAGRAAATWRAYREVSRPGSPGLAARLRALPRMLRAGMRGEYPGLTKGKLAMLGMAVVYIVSPIDVVPDFLLGIGVVDDFGVFLWLMTALLGESGRYVDWETEGVHRTVPGRASRR